MQTIKYIFAIFSILFTNFIGYSQSSDNSIIKSNYKTAYQELLSMLNGNKAIDFKRATFIVENAFVDNIMDYNAFCQVIDEYEYLCRNIIETRNLQYNQSDKSKVSIYASVFTLMTDTLKFQIDSLKTIEHLPFTYDFDDFAGKNDWSQMFVTKLLATKKGNCHSLPYLYKIIIEELGEKAWLSFAPNHTYIKLKCKEFGWFNTELTSGLFPIDAWLMASGYIHLNAIQNRIYMDTLSQKQSIAACLIDLAQGYEKRIGIGNGSFILNACDTALSYYPNYINAMLIKAETKFLLLYSQENLSKIEFEKQKTELEALYKEIHDLGYRKMPDKMYLEWLVSLKEEKSKYQNPLIINYKNK